MNDKIQLELTQDEALVLFERLNQLDQTGALPAEDTEEEQIFWNIQAQLEKVLVEPFDPQYHEILSEAKKRLQDKQKTPNQ